MLRISLKRFRHVGSVVKSEWIELDNGNDITQNKKQFDFIYANIHESLTSKLSNLGNSQNSARMVAVKDDTRFDKLIDNSDYQIQLDNGKTYRITNIAKDDSTLDPIYEISLTINDSNSSSDD